MNTSLLCLVLALSSSWSAPSAEQSDRVGPTSEIFSRAEPYALFDEVLDRLPLMPGAEGSFRAKRTSSSTRPAPSLIKTQRDYVIRAQNPGVRMADVEKPSNNAPRTYAPFSPSTPVEPLIQTPPATPYEPEQTAPILEQPMPVTPYLMTPPPAAAPEVGTWGTQGPQPYRLGYTLWGDMGWLPGRHTDIVGDSSKFEVFEANLGLLHTVPTWWSPWLFSLEHQFGYRSWEGPAQIDLPGGAYRLGWDIKLETPLNSEYRPFAISLAFNPSINSDFDQQLGRQAINFDGRGILFWQADPRLLVALGAGFWDRVHDRVVPYAGVVWLPDDRWEFRLMWPQSRIQWYAGNVMGEDVWFYASAEYHVESYQIGTMSALALQDQIELSDYRAVLGMRKSNRWASGFIEGGWVFGRKVELRTAEDFSVSSGFIGRIGLKF